MKPLQSPAPHYQLASPHFKYTLPADTNVAKTINRYRKRLAAAGGDPFKAALLQSRSRTTHQPLAKPAQAKEKSR